MNYLSCSVAITVDGDNKPICSSGWDIQTAEQLTAQISVNPPVMTPEVYETLSNQMALILLVAFGWRCVLKLVLHKDSNDD